MSNKEKSETWGEFLYKKIYYAPSLIIIAAAVATKVYNGDGAIKTVANYAITFGVIAFFGTYVADDFGFLDCCKDEDVLNNGETTLNEPPVN